MPGMLFASIQPIGSTVHGAPVIHLARMDGAEVATVAIVFGVIAAIFIPLVRAFAKRIESRSESRTLSSDVLARLDHIERSVDAIAVEVERISEGQRFVTQLMSERPKAPSIGAGSQ